MVRPCKECHNEFKPSNCGKCTEWDSWFPEAWDNACAWLRRELEWAQERRERKEAARAAVAAACGRTYRDIVFGTVFTKLWR